jgi:2-polyprenyl-3-methyl-5-hydroxy-6-metoxy-1,4-benzoquinol methylase
MSNARDKQHFQESYQGKPPWDIGKPQSAFVQAADQVTGSVLDAGCGTGENALFFAARGQRVTGIDFLEQPIAEATRKAHQRGLDATFLVDGRSAFGGPTAASSTSFQTKIARTTSPA